MPVCWFQRANSAETKIFRDLEVCVSFFELTYRDVCKSIIALFSDRSIRQPHLRWNFAVYFNRFWKANSASWCILKYCLISCHLARPINKGRNNILHSIIPIYARFLSILFDFGTSAVLRWDWVFYSKALLMQQTSSNENSDGHRQFTSMGHQTNPSLSIFKRWMFWLCADQLRAYSFEQCRSKGLRSGAISRDGLN